MYLVSRWGTQFRSHFQMRLETEASRWLFQNELSKCSSDDAEDGWCIALVFVHLVYSHTFFNPSEVRTWGSSSSDRPLNLGFLTSSFEDST